MTIKNQYQRIVPFIIFLLVLFLFFQLIRPMITIILSSILIAYISFPLYQKIFKRIHNKSLSIILSLFLVVLIILIPFSFIIYEITQQGYFFYHSLSSSIEKGVLFGFGCNSADSKICSFLNMVEKFSLEQLSIFGFDKELQKFLPILEHQITNFVLSIPLIIVQFFLVLVIAYFIIQEWDILLNKIFELFPMRAKTKKRLIREFGNITHTVIYAQLFVALVQGIVGTIGFYIFGVPLPIFLGVIMAFCALIPTIGTAIIWVPVSLFLIISGYSSHDYWALGKGVGLLLYGILIISTIDNLLLAKIVRAKSEVNQIIVILGVIGGASMFGAPGIFIGPILLPLILTYFKTFKERFVL